MILIYPKKTFPPIGQQYRYFAGTFDGQGHTVSNLIMNSSLYYVGLFGYLYGATIKNLVIDDSCSFEGTYSPGGAIGGISAQCTSGDGPCKYESLVNMANVTFSVSRGQFSWMGGIIGQLYSSDEHTYISIVANCVNYGTMSPANSSFSGFVGGIIGECNWGYVHNCLNYGTIVCSSVSSDCLFGGIIDTSYNTIIENCVNTGKIATRKTESYKNIIISARSNTNITHCLWANITILLGRIIIILISSTHAKLNRLRGT